MTVCWVTSSVLKLYWQNSVFPLQSSVMFRSLTTSLVVQTGMVRFSQVRRGSSVTVFISVQLTPWARNYKALSTGYLYLTPTRNVFIVSLYGIKYFFYKYNMKIEKVNVSPEDRRLQDVWPPPSLLALCLDCLPLWCQTFSPVDKDPEIKTSDRLSK